jgi:hypothetical protein
MIKLTGVKEIDKVLNGLPLQVSDKIFQAANIAAAKPLIDKAKLIAPEGPNGNLVDSIGAVKESAKSLSGRAVGQIQVGPRRRGGYKGFHAHLIEYPHKKRNGKGIVQPHPFMQPAFEQTKNQILAGVKDQIGIKLNQFMRRTIKNA